MRAALLLVFGIAGCHPAPVTLTEADRAAVADSAKSALQALMNSGSNHDSAGYVAKLSLDPDAKYATAGNLSGSAAEVGASVAAPFLSSLTQTLDGWFPAVLAPDAVAFTAPYHFTATLKGRAEPYPGSGVISGVVQRRNGTWRIIQYHESFNKQDELLATAAAAASGSKW